MAPKLSSQWKSVQVVGLVWKDYLLQNSPKNQIKKLKKKEIDITKIPSASPSKRICSGLIDFIIAIGLTLLVWTIIGKKIALSGTKSRWLILRLILPFLPALYFVLKDSLGGKSFGKMIVGLTAVSLDKLKPASISDSLLRNAIFALIAIPVIGWFAFLVFAILSGVQIILGRPQRLGDGFAHTVVIDDRNLELLDKIKNE